MSSKTYKTLLCSAFVCAGLLNTSPLKAGVSASEINTVVNAIQKILKLSIDLQRKAQIEAIIKKIEAARFQLDISEHALESLKEEFRKLVNRLAPLAKKGDAEARKFLEKVLPFYSDLSKQAKTVGKNKAEDFEDPDISLDTRNVDLF